MLAQLGIVQSKVKLTISLQPDLYQYYCVRCVCCIVRTAYSRPLLSIQREVYALLVVQATRYHSISVLNCFGLLFCEQVLAGRVRTSSFECVGLGLIHLAKGYFVFH